MSEGFFRSDHYLPTEYDPRVETGKVKWNVPMWLLDCTYVGFVQNIVFNSERPSFTWKQIICLLLDDKYFRQIKWVLYIYEPRVIESNPLIWWWYWIFIFTWFFSNDYLKISLQILRTEQFTVDRKCRNITFFILVTKICTTKNRSKRM